MSEHVFDYDAWAVEMRDALPEHTWLGVYMAIKDVMHRRKREPIVRCRDCRFYTPESMSSEERDLGIYEDVWEPGGCFNPRRCSIDGDPFGEWHVIGIDTEPDGFCKWGECKVVDE